MTAAVDTRTPMRVRTDPWPHQREAFDFALSRPGTMLGIAMGGGKGLVAIALLEHDREHRARMLSSIPLRVLILCPRSVVGVWPKQLNEHGTSDWATWAGDVVGTRGPLKNPSVARRAAALVDATKLATATKRPLAAIVNFEACHAGDMGRITLGTPWDVLIVDESHRVKAPGGKASRHAYHIAEKIRRRGGRVLCLTGTPMPHTPFDIWAQLRVIDGGQRLGTSYHQFCQRYGKGETIWAPGGRQVTKYSELEPERTDQFTGLVGEVTYQLDQDTLDRQLGLPETVDVNRIVDLDSKTRKAYDQLERDLIADLGDAGVVTAANAMVLTTRLAQLSGGFAKDPDGRLVHITSPPEKARLLADVLEDIDEREPVVVFCRFHADLDQVRHVAGKLGRRYGELSGRRRDGLAPDATLAPGVQILGAQLQSGGVGIDLTAARYAIYYSLNFSLADHVQSRKRVHRPGQTRRTTYITLLAADTIDFAVYGALQKRADVINAVLERLNGRDG